ncbi:GNAT family N-acetyltransferase [uncultured Corynebacterium sp.]|uniref:GNAT family N-acetyltransferase n=1 Tax=uncultured Corynebacterium sp. TaxID=159447 RepID=UPI0025F08D09|nr:GNAT family N-acetyltransferase [uncultured Corynebacterium sp.]
MSTHENTNAAGNTEEIAVAQQTDLSRYVLTVDGAEAGYAEYIDTDETREFNHTVVHEAFQGKGLSKPLVQFALDDTREAGRSVIATCSAVARFIEKNPDYADLLA